MKYQKSGSTGAIEVTANNGKFEFDKFVKTQKASGVKVLEMKLPDSNGKCVIEVDALGHFICAALGAAIEKHGDMFGTGELSGKNSALVGKEFVKLFQK